MLLRKGHFCKFTFFAMKVQIIMGYQDTETGCQAFLILFYKRLKRSHFFLAVEAFYFLARFAAGFNESERELQGVSCGN
jgi:hypothetical protein